ncbi:VWA domain-containing protein [Leeuwenhoekiella polynyae]|uniref:VWA domain-containing protein n=1 Tax=Leeuwenhoekiella polynyae TaxID=1550906 RepID=A0A4Q0P7R2_9FLAO|nr:VWA domain-containing protein [Leeuwenhoekiella polynyae]RXG22328.1 hypothetical protein DSM02_1928 [Leeuwenhoekiella polynyae]
MAASTILYIILSGIIALGAAIFFYFYKPQRSKQLKFILSTLRFLTLFSVLILLINPSFKQVTYSTIKPKLSLAIDNSRSMEYLGDTTQIQSVFNSFSENEELNNRFDIDYYSFGRNLKPLTALNFDEGQTDIAKSLKDLNQIYKGIDFTPVIVTDGNSNLGADYRYTAQENNSNPFYFLAVGDTLVYEDLSLDRINTNKYAYLNNEFPVELITSYTGEFDVNATVSVSQNGRIIHKEQQAFTPENSSQRTNFYLNASSIGVQRYQVTVSGLDNEKNLENNTKNFAVEVIDQRSNVLIVYSVLHPDLGTLKKGIESNQLRAVTLKEISEVNLTEFNDYDLVILFEPEESFSSVYKELNKEHKNRFTIIGTQTDLSFLNSIQQTGIFPKNNESELVQPDKNESFDAFQLEELSFDNFPPLASIFGKALFTGDSDVLFYQRINGVTTQNPLLAVTERSGRREVFLLGTGIFQWRSQSFIDNQSFENFDNFIDKLVQYAASNQHRKRLEISYEQFYYKGNFINIQAQYFDKNYVFDPGASLQIELRNENSEETYQSPLVFKGSAYEVELSNLEPGDYTFRITETDQNVSSGGSFTIIPFDLERQSLNANFQKMKTLAQESGGNIYTLENYNRLVDELLNSDQFIPVERAVKKNVPLINFVWLLALIVACLTAEWFIRKYNGLI